LKYIRPRPWIAILIVLLSGSARATEILGQRPGYLKTAPSQVPNHQAIERRIWAPGLEDGFVPQGLAWNGGTLYVSAYRSTDPKVNGGPCRLFRVDPESGRTLGHFDLPPSCQHAGGVASAGPGHVVVADSRRLYKISVDAAFGSDPDSEAVVATVGLARGLKGSFAAARGGNLFLGTYTKQPLASRGYLVPMTVFQTHNKRAIDESAAVRSIALPVRAQGAAFDRTGGLWITASGSRFGRLYEVDPENGSVRQSREMVVGIEDIAFDDDGGLWSVSEAGSRRWINWGITYPLLFRINVLKLQ